MSPDLIALFQVLRMQSLPISPGAKLTNYGLLKNVRSSLITDIHSSYDGKVCMLGVGKQRKKRRLLRRLSSRLSSLAMRVVIQDGTKLRHIRPRNGLQGFTCFDVVGRVSAVLMG